MNLLDDFSGQHFLILSLISSIQQPVQNEIFVIYRIKLAAVKIPS